MKKQVSVLVESEFHDIEFWYPYYRLTEAGFSPIIVAPVAPSSYTGKYGTHIEATYSPTSISALEVKAVIIPGGWAPDKLRQSTEMVEFVSSVYKNGGLVAGICHAGSLMVSADILKGRRVTSFISVRDDMVLAGAEWTDEPVAVDRKLVTSRRPADLPFFMKAVIENIEKD